MGRIAFSAILLCSLAIRASSQGWERSEKTDQLRGSHFSQFVLNGKFLVAPTNTKVGDVPKMVLHCLDQPHSIGYRVYKNGRFLSGYISTGTVLDSQVAMREGLLTTRFPVVVEATYRLDAGKLQSEAWGISTDRTAAFFRDTTLNNFLYAHTTQHRENTNPAVQKIVLGLSEAFAGEIQMQFDLPDPAEVAETCGVTYHKGTTRVAK